MDEKLSLLKKRLLAAGRRETKPVNELKVEKKSKPLILPADWEKVTEFVYRRIQILADPLDSTLLPDNVILPAPAAKEELLFFDVETTGLSGGAGNMIFLIGLGSCVDKGFCIEQYFLADFPGEPDFLECLSRQLTPDKLFVSYNGRSFDSHVIASRFLMNGLKIAFPRHLDLLYLARRLWKQSIGSCNLGHIEECILGLERTGDIPGYLVPEVYFQYLKSGQTAELEKVFYHNYMDIHSLGLLLNHMLRIFAGLETDELTSQQAVGEYYLAQGQGQGTTVLEKDFASGCQQSGRSLSLYYKRKGDWEKAVNVWQRMCESRTSYFAAVELAKFFEHKRRQYDTALKWVEKISSNSLPLSQEERAELCRRKERLQKKLTREKSSDVSSQ